MNSSDKYKEATKHNWGKDPCGSNLVNDEKKYLSKEYFDELDRKKFETDKWKEEEFKSFQIKGKKILEIGYGMGSDHLALAKCGAVCHGIDITEGNRPIAQKHLEMNGYHSELILGDAENMPYEDNTFDFVYSFGVIHHTPNMEKAVQEIHRILRPGGACWIGVYNKNSWFYRCMLLPTYFISGDFRKMTIMERLSLIEYPNTNKDIMVRLTTKRELKKMFQQFSIDTIKTRGLTRGSFIFGGRLLTDSVMERMSHWCGWYNIVRATKKKAE